MRPAGIALDKLPDPADVIARNSILWEVFKKHRETGLADLETAATDLSPFERARLRAIVSEEMGWGDSGLAISLGVANFHKIFAMMSGRPALIERFVTGGQDEIGCWAVTEPDHGSDSLTVTEPHYSDPSIRANCIAVRDGDDYIIRGQKSAWVSNGTVATVAALFCTIDGDQGFRGGGVCVVPLTLPGVTKGKPLNKLGQRALNQGEIFFDDVRVPAENMVIGKENYAAIVEQILTMANASMGVTFVGVAWLLVVVLAGVVLSARMGSGQPAIGEGLEFESIAAAVLGGAKLGGGEGRVLGTVFGVLFLALLGNGLNLVRVSSFTQMLVIGAVLIVAIVADRLRQGWR